MDARHLIDGEAELDDEEVDETTAALNGLETGLVDSSEEEEDDDDEEAARAVFTFATSISFRDKKGLTVLAPDPRWLY